MADTFNGSEGESISLATGQAMTARHRAAFPSQVKGRFFGSDLLKQILAQPGCKGIRFYFAQDEEGVFELVICGADGSANDMLDLIGDMSMACPAMCSTNNDLNS